MKHPQLKERKLGREKAMGLADFNSNSIEIDPRQNGKELIDTLLHERLHLLFPDWSEKKVASTSKKLSAFLWRNHVRILRK